VDKDSFINMYTPFLDNASKGISECLIGLDTTGLNRSSRDLAKPATIGKHPCLTGKAYKKRTHNISIANMAGGRKILGFSGFFKLLFPGT